LYTLQANTRRHHSATDQHIYKTQSSHVRMPSSLTHPYYISYYPQTDEH
jgi:hypothetical protein